MTIRQLSIFLENKSGRLTEVLETLGNEKINITALSIADTSEYGILRLIVSDPTKAHQLLKKKSFSVNLNEVISLWVSPEAGSYAKVLKCFSEDGLSIEYMYAFCLGDKSVLVLRTDNRPKAFETIKKYDLKVIREADLKHL
jgi:hypothetical protein